MKATIVRTFALACVLVVAACVYVYPRSYLRSDGVFLFGGSAGTAAAAACEGEIVMGFGNIDSGHDRTLSVRCFSDDAETIAAHRGELLDQLATQWHRGGLTVGWTRRGAMQTDGAWFVMLVVPVWLWITLALPWPLAWLLHRLRLRRRGRMGLCPGCGYDLRASTGRCSECGREIGAGVARRQTEGGGGGGGGGAPAPPGGYGTPPEPGTGAGPVPAP